MAKLSLKDALTFEQQLDRLECFHKLTIPNRKNALKILQKVNYYRLTAYGAGLTKPDNKEEYRQGVSIKTLYDLYIFDSKLRNILIKEIETLEVYLRTHISYILGITYGPIGYLNPKNFNPIKLDKLNETVHEHIMKNLNHEISRQKDQPFVKHHIGKYNGKFPIWVASELFSLGTLSSLYRIMKRKDKKCVSSLFGISPDRLYSWMLTLLEIRNKCAHYCRLYNMPMKTTPLLFDEDKKYFDPNFGPRLFLSILVLKRMMEKSFKFDWNSFYFQIKSIFRKHSNVLNLSYIGFPKDWDEIIK
ncbi:MAG: Abi family protein [Bacilli bacterium]|nr:Abi family protein [Bacilli bacterium]